MRSQRHQTDTHVSNRDDYCFGINIQIAHATTPPPPPLSLSHTHTPTTLARTLSVKENIPQEPVSQIMSSTVSPILEDDDMKGDDQGVDAFLDRFCSAFRALLRKNSALSSEMYMRLLQEQLDMTVLVGSSISVKLDGSVCGEIKVPYLFLRDGFAVSMSVSAKKTVPKAEDVDSTRMCVDQLRGRLPGGCSVTGVVLNHYKGHLTGLRVEDTGDTTAIRDDQCDDF